MSAETPKHSTGKYHFFWQSESPFSQWHKSKYELNGFVYCCAEQGMMHGKALLFGDQKVAKAILETQSPRKIKSLGRQVKSFDDKGWTTERIKIVKENTIAKFTQNRQLLEALMNTSGLLVEASPCDSIWGIGLSEEVAREIPEEKWPGMNLLGKILTAVRDEIHETNVKSDKEDVV